MGSRFCHRKEQFSGLSGPLKSIDSLCYRVCIANHSIHNNGMTAGLLQPTAMFPNGRCHSTLSPLKKSPPCDAAFRRIFHTTGFNISGRRPQLAAIAARSWSQAPSSRIGKVTQSSNEHQLRKPASAGRTQTAFCLRHIRFLGGE